MVRVPVPALVLLAGASWLIFGAWWEASSGSGGVGPPANGGPISRPELTTSGKKPEEEKSEPEEQLADPEAVLAALREAGSPARRSQILWNEPRRIPYHAELARYLVSVIDQYANRVAVTIRLRLIVMGARAAPHVSALLTHPKHRVRYDALWIMQRWRETGQEFKMPAFLPLLDDPHKSVRSAAVALIALGVPYDAELAQRLVAMVDAKPQHAGRGVSTGLARMGPKGIAHLVELLDVPDVRVRVAALQGMRRAPKEELKALLPHVMGAMQSPDHLMRVAGVQTLLAFGGGCERCLPVLRETIQEQSYDVVRSTLRVLQQMGPRAAEMVPYVVEHLRWPDARMVEVAAETLGKMRSRPDIALPALADLVSREATDAASVAMARFGLAAYEHALRVFEEGDAEARYSILWTFAKLEEKATPFVPRLIELVDGEDGRMRMRAIGTLGFIGPKARAAIPSIMANLARGPKHLAPWAAAGTLGRFGKASEKPIRDALRSKDPTLRLQAVKVVMAYKSGADFALDDLEPLLGDKDVQIRRAALQAIGFGAFQPEKDGHVLRLKPDAPLVGRIRAHIEQALAGKDREMQEFAQLWLADADS